MGMYDRLAIATNWLPEGKRIPTDEQDFQTKSFHCLLELYEILEDGSLMRTVELESGETIEPHNFTGAINFYTLECDYVAWCVNGIVKEVIDLTT